MYFTFAAPCVSNIPLPSREDIWLDEDGSFSSEITDSDMESLVSEQSSDALTTDCEAGNCNDDQEEEMDNDDDDDVDNNSDSEARDGYDNSSRDIQEPDLLGVEAAMFIGGPWQGLDLSAEEQLQSLQSGKNKASKFSLLFSYILRDFTGEGSFELTRLFLLIAFLVESSPLPLSDPGFNGDDFLPKGIVLELFYT